MTTSATHQDNKQAADKNAIRPFREDVPETELTELRKRVNATKWPERETVAFVTVKAFTRNITIPARPFLVIRPEDPERIREEVRQFAIARTKESGLA